MKLITKINLGKIGEKHAADYLRRNGIKVIGANWRCFIGEIDLLGIDRDELVFVEVKTRINSSYSNKHILDSIDKRKKWKLRNLSKIFLKQRKLEDRKHRIDVIGILICPKTFEPLEFRHIVGAVGSK